MAFLRQRWSSFVLVENSLLPQTLVFRLLGGKLFARQVLLPLVLVLAIVFGLDLELSVFYLDRKGVLCQFSRAHFRRREVLL
jgi:hypothetical protein|tara:strand:- start:4496 stop:4741 length:246 start_codon:yes stop_codon:yes gene_type:complete